MQTSTTSSTYSSSDELVTAAAVVAFLAGALVLVALIIAAVFVPHMWAGVALLAIHVPVAAAVAARTVTKRSRRPRQLASSAMTRPTSVTVLPLAS